MFTEFDPIDAPKLNEKVLKDKRKKLRETFTRVYRLYVSIIANTYLYASLHLGAERVLP